MKFKIDNYFSLNQIAESGQCFRWIKKGDNHYHIIANNQVLDVSQNGKILDLSCSLSEFENYWFNYFDLGTDYGKVFNSINKDDHFLVTAAQHSKGIRILNQEPFETLISFIISQQKTIPNIKSTIERISKLSGNLVDSKNNYYSFPTIEQFYHMSEKNMKSLKLGYREKYILRTRDELFNNRKTFENSKSLNDKDLKNYLKGFYGVGEKVANCVLLFGYHRLNAFPVDTWVNKALDKEYNLKEIDDYTPYNGIIQQYIFHYYRNIKSKIN